MDTNEQIILLDDIAKSFQRESEALREIVRSRDMTIAALRAHSLCMKTNFQILIHSIIEKFVDDDIQFHARRMADALSVGETIDEPKP